MTPDHTHTNRGEMKEGMKGGRGLEGCNMKVRVSGGEIYREGLSGAAVTRHQK